MIPVTEPCIGDREVELVTDAVSRGWVSPAGGYVKEFEEAVADWIGTDHAFAVSTGTSALHLSLAAADIGPGDEVVVPSLTWIACANVVRYLGATPVFADVDPQTYTIDPESLRDCVTDDTVAVMPVHLYGQPCDMDGVAAVAAEHDLRVVEDSAEAHGALYRNREVGSVGDIGCFSFYGNKILTTGQGGMITTDDDGLAERIRLLRRDGMSTERKYYHPVVGYNYRLSNVQAALGVAQVERLDDILAGKARVAATYRRELVDTDVRFQGSPSWGSSANWMVAPVFESTAQRDRVAEALAVHDVETRPFFHPLHLQPPYEAGATACPTAETLADRGLNLPSGPRLDEETVVDICDHVADAL